MDGNILAAVAAGAVALLALVFLGVVQIDGLSLGAGPEIISRD